MMMFADYFLTVFGGIQSKKGYSLHFKTEHYELNPIWQKHIAQRKWFNPRQIMLALVVSVALVLLLELEEVPDSLAQGILGAVMVLYAVVLGRHVSNLLIFQHLIHRPEEISGQVAMSHPLVLSISLYTTLVTIIPIALVAVFSKSEFAIGGTAGLALFCLVQLRWIRMARKARTSAVNPGPGDSP
jgi:hypothetical protein